MLNKREELLKLQPGTSIKLTTGSIIQFERVKQKKFVGIISGVQHDISINLFDSVVEKTEQTQEVKTTTTKQEHDRELTAFRELMNMQTGTIVSLTNGEEAEFVRLKQKNFIGIINGSAYDIPIAMYNGVIKIVEKNTGYTKLKVGEPFLIKNNKSEVLLFKFKEFSNGKIVGINPITKVLTRISPDLYIGTVSEI